MTTGENAGNIPRMNTDRLLARIDERLKALGLSENAACEKARIDRGTIRDLRRKKRDSVTLGTLAKLAAALDTTTAWLTAETDDVAPAELKVVPIAAAEWNGPSEAERKSMPENGATYLLRKDGVPEVATRGHLGAGGIQAFDLIETRNGITISQDLVAAEWGIPDTFLQSLRVQRRSLRILSVDGDSGYDPARPDLPGSLFPGDKAFVDIEDRRPSPPGPFAVWDGIGVVVKWLEVEDEGGAPVIVLRSRNPLYPERRRHADEVTILGRVCGRITVF